MSDEKVVGIVNHADFLLIERSNDHNEITGHHFGHGPAAAQNAPWGIRRRTRHREERNGLFFAADLLTGLDFVQRQIVFRDWMSCS